VIADGLKLRGVVFDEDRTIAVCSHIARSWRTKSKALGGQISPEVIHLPCSIEYGSLDHVRYLLFIGWLSRSGKTADEVIESGARVAIREPWLLTHQGICDHSVAHYGSIMKFMVPYAETKNQRDLYLWWRECCETVERKPFNGDLRNVFLRHTSVISKDDRWRSRELIINDLCRLKGIAHKIAQLIAIWVQEVNWSKNAIKWNRIRKIPFIPVDLWCMRLVYMSGMVIGFNGDHRDRIGRPISDYLSKVCLEHDISHTDLAQGLWHIGARIHAKMPRNTKQTQYCHDRCPLHNYCTWIVNSDPVNRQRGLIGWHSAVPRSAYPYTTSIFTEPAGL